MAVEPVSLTIGTASLAIQLLYGCVKGYKKFAALSVMPKECKYLQTRLQYERLKFGDWCQAAGFRDYEENPGLPDSVKGAALVLVAILTQTQLVMDELAKMTVKYKEMRKSKDAIVGADLDSKEIAETLSSLSILHDEDARPRQSLSGSGALVSMATNLKAVVKDPKRVLWVIKDEKAFEKCLRRLQELNGNLHELLHGQDAQNLMDLVRKTQLDMVLVLQTVEELKHLYTAATLLSEKSVGTGSRGKIVQQNDHVLASLAKFKQLSAAADSPVESLDEGKQSLYEKAKEGTKLEYQRIQKLEESRDAEDINDKPNGRIAGKLDAGKPTERDVWIEWRTYHHVYNDGLRRYVPLPDNLRRVQELVALLQGEKLDEFCVPKCCGFFDDREDELESEHPYRFGLVFEEADYSKISVPTSLARLLTDPNPVPPSLTDRVQLAHKLATCLLYLHAVNWLHKGICSDSVIFPNPDDLAKPYLSGFDYSRPDTELDQTKQGTTATDDPKADLYRHPDYQGPGPKGHYRKTYDIYSLGLVLFEIAMWEPIEDIVDLEGRLSNTEKLQGIPKILMEEENMALLKANVGNRYQQAVAACIEGCPAFGLRHDDDEINTVNAATLLQRGFQIHVVDALSSIIL